MADQAPQAGGEGGGFSLSTLPVWVWLAAGGGAIGLYLLWRRHNAAAPSGDGTNYDTGASVAPVVDSSTGGLVDPLTGLPYLTSQPAQQTQDNSTWLQSAEAAAKTLGYAPALVQSALYNFLNGNALNNKEAGVINALLGKVGYPPILIPFLGTPPSTTPPKPTKAPKKGYVWELVNGVWRQIRFASQGPVPKPVTRGGKVPDTPLRPIVPGVGQHPTPHSPAPKPSPALYPTPKAASFIQSVLGGNAPLPTGVKLPAGYHFRSGTRYLVKNKAA